MNKNKVTKILVLLLILGLIIMKACSVGAASLNEIVGPNNETSNLQTGNDSFDDLLNTGATQNTANTPTNNTINNLNNRTNRTNTNSTLPKTGTNENIIIGLMVICTVAGLYAFKKVKDYNM